MPQRLEGVDAAARKDLEPFRPVIEATLGGFLPNSMFIMAHNPELLLGFGLMSKAVFRGSDRTKVKLGKLIVSGLKQVWTAFRRKPEPAISDELRALIFLAVSLSAGCRYCQAHSATQALDRGTSQAKLDAILQFETSDTYSEAERAALSVAFAAGEVPNGVTDTHFTALKTHFSTAEIVDIVSAIAYMGFLNRWNDTFATLLEDRPKDTGALNLAKLDWQLGKHGPPG